MNGANGTETLFLRDCGLLLHPTSLCADYGVGDFGPEAVRWVERLAANGQNLWQILPLNPAGYGDSPYQGLSAFAANSVFLSPEGLVRDGLLSEASAREMRRTPGEAVDYAEVYAAKRAMMEEVADGFFRLEPAAPLRREFAAFADSEKGWLDHFALFMALKARHGGVAWTEWPEPLRDRHPEAIGEAASEMAAEVNRVRLEQFLLQRQWAAVRACAARHGVRIVGDLPIFVAHDSADVWCARELFRLNPDGSPQVMAGVPPDYFSSTGQLWGNPLYAWDAHRADGFAWWRARLRKILEWVDVVRIDHFRGFQAFWEVPGDAETASGGHWVEAPGYEVFDAFAEDLGRPLPVIAEDLGVITPEVTALRDHYRLPGIRIEQFAFGDDPMRDTFLPESYHANCVAYPGTHDNDTVVGWFHSEAGEGSTRSADQIEREREAALKYFGTNGDAIHWDFIRSLYQSDAGAVVIPAQDVLGLGSAARMNTPGVASGSWRWRLTDNAAMDAALAELAELTRRTCRGLYGGERQAAAT